MRKIVFMLAALLVAFVAHAQQKQSLRVLYVGGSSDWEESTPELAARRAASFQAYLNQHFTEVKVVAGVDYTPALSGGYDVTIFDGRLPQTVPALCTKDASGKMKDYYTAKSLDESFAYPAILIADAGDRIGRGIGAKTDWYCLCLDAHAHHSNLNHPIFKGPFAVNIQQEILPTPSDAFHYQYYYNGIMPKTLPMWRVQTKGFVSDAGFRIGMVARPWGFTDSPDCESISSGVCQKTLDAVAIGRHGNFFFWGFSASPEYMTEAAKQVFANAVVYTAGLKGEKMIARKYYDRAATREYVKELAYCATPQAYQDRIKLEEEFYKRLAAEKEAALAKKNRGEKLSQEEEQRLTMDVAQPEMGSYDDYLKKQMRNGYYEQFKGDTKAFAKYLKTNTPYFYGAGMFYQLVVDGDVKTLKIANNDIRLLDKAISLLEKGNLHEKEMGRRILDRYTLCTFSKPEQWRKWFEENKSRIFFTESGGWLFMVNTKDAAVEGNNYEKKAEYLAAETLKLADPDDRNPVTCGATLVTYTNGRQSVLVKLKIRGGYHIYGNVSSKDPYVATAVQVELPQGYQVSGAMKIPAGAFFSESGTTQYTDEVFFVQPISGYGKGIVKATCQWQCCDSQICFPPAEQVLEVATSLVSAR